MLDTNAKWLEPLHVYNLNNPPAFQGRRLKHKPKPKAKTPEELAILGLKERALVPSVTPIAWLQDQLAQDVLMLGQVTMLVVGMAGELKLEYALPDLPVALPTMGDFSNDQWTDVVVMTPSGILKFCCVFLFVRRLP